MWNNTIQELYDKAKVPIKTCMEFYSENELLYLDADASGIGLEAGLLQLREAIIIKW